MSSSSSTLAGKLLPRMVLIGLGVALSLVALEVTLRVLPLDSMGYRSTAIEVTGSHRTPGPDFRQRRFAVTKKPGRYRILAIGDSFTWGVGVLQEDAYPDRIQAFWNLRHPDAPIEVVNWSRPGWNTAREWDHVRGKLRRLNPDVIVLGFVLNDAEPVSPERLERLRARRQRREPEFLVSRWLHAHSRAYNLLFEKTEDLRQRRALEDYYYSLYGENGGWEFNRTALAKFQRWCDRHSVPLLIVIFPIFNTQIDDGYPYRDLHSLVADEANGLKIEVLDLLPEYEGLDARRLAIVPFTDGHPNEIAHRIAALKIIDRLTSEGWMPAEATDDGDS